MNPISVQPVWCQNLPLQQQSVLFLAARGPDGVAKYHPSKPIHVAYRGTICMAGKYGRMLAWGEKADSFMSLHVFSDDQAWDAAVDAWFSHCDSLDYHYLLHFYHGVEILGYKHPDQRFRDRWLKFYLKACEWMHVNPETEEQMDRRLGDWGREHWA